MKSSLKPRLLTAAVGIPAALVVVILSELWHPLLGIVLGAFSAVMVGEFLYARRLLSCIPLAAVCMLYAFAMQLFTSITAMYIVTFALMIISFCVIIFYHDRLGFMSFAYALFGTLLITYGTHAVIRACNGGVCFSFYLVAMLLLPWMADGGGYFIGSKFGRHKLCPNISPKKTIEGALGGAVFCVASAMLMGLLYQFVITPGYQINFAALVVLALLDSVVSILGDLSFSLIKRSLKIKDYGSVFPGHGGVLDRFDSIIFTAPLTVVMMSLVPLVSVAVE